MWPPAPPQRGNAPLLEIVPRRRASGCPYPAESFAVLSHRPATAFVDLLQLLFEVRIVLHGTGNRQNGFPTPPTRRRPQPILQRRFEETPLGAEQAAGQFLLPHEAHDFLLGDPQVRRGLGQVQYVLWPYCLRASFPWRFCTGLCHLGILRISNRLGLRSQSNRRHRTRQGTASLLTAAGTA